MYTSRQRNKQLIYTRQEGLTFLMDEPYYLLINVE